MPTLTDQPSIRRSPKPPGPDIGLGIKAGIEASSDYLGYFTRLANQYGDLCVVNFFRYHMVFVNKPEYIESVLVTNYHKFHKSPDYRALNRLLGDGLLTSEGDFWRRQRKLAQPAFHRDKIASYAEIMTESAGRLLDSWTGGETRDIHSEMMAVTLDIVARCLFQSDLSRLTAVVRDALHDSMEEYVQRASSGFLFPEWWPASSNRRYHLAVKRLDEIVFDLIEEHRGPNHNDDLLGMLLSARDDDGQPMTARQIRDEVMTLFLAGHETTANALAWTFYQLEQNPEVEATLQAELASVLDGRLPDLADVPKLRYTSMVMKESMRLYPPAWGMGREAIEPFELGGYRFDKGMYVFLCQYITHRDPRFFDDPLRFQPDRWSEQAERRVPKFAYFPFGAGPRVCVGAAFAQMESTLLLAAIASRYRFRLDPGQRVVPLPSITMRPRYGLRMRLDKVQPGRLYA